MSVTGFLKFKPNVVGVAFNCSSSSQKLFVLVITAVIVYFSDAPNIGLFTFQGNVNKAIGSNDVGDISGEVRNGAAW